jgi:transposase
MINYNTNQYALSIALDFIPEKNDIARVIDSLIDSIPDSTFQPFYRAEGRPRYSPKMMLKLILCGYSLKAFSGRKIEDLVKDSKRMGWLAQGATPSYRTINRMRVHRLLTKVIEEAYVQLHCQLIEQKMIDGEAPFIDGTKIEANANKYTFVWRKSIENYQKSLIQKAKDVYSELLVQEIIPELKDEVKEELTEVQLAAILYHLDETIEEITEEIDNSTITETRKSLRTKRKAPKQYRKQVVDFLQRKKKYEIH